MMKQATNSDHLIKRILASQEPRMAALRYGLAAAMAALGLVSLVSCAQTLLPQFIYRKDFIQEYLLAKAMLRGMNPYTPLPELANRFIGPLPNLIFLHPTPHPPPVALLSLPLGYLSYQQAAIVWFIFELACVLVSVYGLLRLRDMRPRVLHVLFIALLALTWSAFFTELAVGQLMTLMLALLVGAWQMMRAGKAVWCGILLGSAIALKLIVWPLAIFFALRGKWRVVCAAGAVLIVANGAAALFMGFQTVSGYYLKVGPLVASLYRAHFCNFSLWTITWRVFDGTNSPVLCGIKALAPVNAPGLAGYLAFLPPVILLGIGFFMALRASSFEASFGLLICLSLLVAPIAWSNYLILTSIPLAFVMHRLWCLDLPDRETIIAFMLVFLLFIPESFLNGIMLMFTDQKWCDACRPSVHFSVTLISLIPAAAVLGLLWLVQHVDQMSKQLDCGSSDTAPN